MKYMFTLGLILFLTACEPSTKTVNNRYDIPEGLKDCKFYYLSSGTGMDITVVRCPLSTTGVSYKGGKTTEYSSTIEI